jgi:hypothetical protein
MEIGVSDASIIGAYFALEIEIGFRYRSATQAKRAGRPRICEGICEREEVDEYG